MVKLKVKHLSTALTVLYILGIIPIVILGFYNFPSADDFSMALETHQKFASTGNVFAALAHGLYMGYWYYMNWTGYFFSAALTALCPAVFTEGLYSLTTVIMLASLTFGALFFFDAALARKLGLPREYARIVAFLTLLPMIESMPAGGPRNEAFYWYSGSINYCFMFGLGLIYAGMILRLSERRPEQKNTALLIGTSVFGLLLGGANYMTALSLAVVSASFAVMDILVRRKSDKKTKSYLWIPAIFNLLGLITSMIAPGNSVRGEMLNSMNPVVAVIRSIYHVFDLCINGQLKWEVIVMLAAISVVCFAASGQVQHRFEHPILFSVFCFLMVAVNIVPPLYATGSFEAGRMVSIIWMQFVLMMVLIAMYVSIWLGQRLGTKDRAKAISGVLPLAALLVTGLVLSVYVDRDYITSTSAISELMSGEASVYASENRQRLEILKDSTALDAELPAHSVKPSLLYFSDITEDTQDWVNKAVAEYYDKNSVKLVK